MEEEYEPLPPWSADQAADELRRGLPLYKPSYQVMAYYREQLQAAYERGRDDQWIASQAAMREALATVRTGPGRGNGRRRRKSNGDDV